MKHTLTLALVVFLTCGVTSCAYKNGKIAQDVTMGQNHLEKLDWRYSSSDIKIQCSQILTTLMDRWVIKTGWENEKPRPNFIVEPIDNRTETHISTDMLKNIFEGAAVSDGRFTVVVSDMSKEANPDLFSQQSRKQEIDMMAGPEFLIKVRLTETNLDQPEYTIIDYRVAVTMYNIESQEVVDSCCHVLSKKVDR